MKFDIYAGKHILYKENGQWVPGVLDTGKTSIDNTGVYLPIVGKEEQVELNNLYLESFKIDDWLKEDSDYFMTKEQYIEFISTDKFDKAFEYAFVSDGEYGYYPISKFTKNWIEKQPFDYVVRGE